MRRWIVITVSFALATVLFMWVNTWYRMIDMSSLDVSVHRSLSLDSVQIKRGLYSINRANDLELFEDNNNDWVLFDGTQAGSLNSDYGENDFLITYGDRSYFVFRHFITNSNNQHDYGFTLELRNDILYLDVDIDGPDAMHFTRPMNRILEAPSLLLNRPIDSTKVIYNMVELE